MLPNGQPWNRVRFLAEATDIFLFHNVQTASGEQPDSYIMIIEGPFPRVQRLGHEADHSPPFSAKVKNAKSCTSTLGGGGRSGGTLCLQNIVLYEEHGEIYFYQRSVRGIYFEKTNQFQYDLCICNYYYYYLRTQYVNCIGTNVGMINELKIIWKEAVVV
jgi:hypothetical protein